MKYPKNIFPSIGCNHEFASNATWGKGSKMKNGYNELNVETWLIKPNIETLTKIKNDLYRTLRPIYKDSIVIVEVPSVKTQGKFSFIRLKICSNGQCILKSRVLEIFKEIILMNYEYN